MVRLKHRYLLLEILYPALPSTGTKPTPVPDIIQFHAPTSEKVTPQILSRIIRDGVAELFGDYGAGVIGGSLAVKYFSPATSTAIIRCPRAHFRLVWAALTFVTHIAGETSKIPCVMHVVRVGGTIRKAEEACIRRGRALALKARMDGSVQDGELEQAGLVRFVGLKDTERDDVVMSGVDDRSGEDVDEEEDGVEGEDEDPG